MTKAIYPGSFDPMTMGHAGIAERAARLFEELIICVYDSPLSKSLLFSTEDRVALAESYTQHIPNVRVTTYARDLTVNLARQLGATAMIRGLRNGGDLVSEMELAQMNRQLDPEIESVFIMTAAEHQFVSSSLLKEAASLGGDISGLVSPAVAEALRQKYNQ
ncbi:MAG: pantetheine-phosphate adenylyltransferase [Dehalococcoidia bacterium]|nr:pantetheine-phosphate adenylyltransferase [Dehalococcoidia bacterium]